MSKLEKEIHADSNRTNKVHIEKLKAEFSKGSD